MPEPVYHRPRMERRPPPQSQGCRKHPHPDDRSAVEQILALIVKGRHQPERGPLHYYRCPDCGAIHVGHETWTRV